MNKNYSTKCGKMAFSTKEETEMAIRDREFDLPRWSGRAYECPQCGNWHMTTQKDFFSLEDDIVSQKRREQVEKKKESNLNNTGTTVEGSRKVSHSSSSEINSGTIANMLDEDTLRKLGMFDS